MSSNGALIVIIFVLIILFGVSEFFHYMERKSLYNRLMARDLTEVKTYETPNKGSKATTRGNPIRNKLVEDGIYDEGR